MTIHHQDPWLTVHVGDCRAVLATMPERSVHCVVTSPPYWGLRDYGTATWDGGDAACDHLAQPAGGTRNKGWDRAASGGRFHDSPNVEPSLAMPYRNTCGKCGATRQDAQLGLEATPEEYVANMVAVVREVRRVLRDDGTLWLNLGDSYATSNPVGRRDNGREVDGRRVGTVEEQDGSFSLNVRRDTGLKPKDLVGIPWRVAFALQADGWYLRSDIIWAKPNPMPESVTDRPTKSHEYLFLLAKSERYYFDADAVREAAVGANEHDLTGPGYAAPGQTPQTGSRVRNVGGRADGFTRMPGGAKEWDQRGVAGRNIRSVWSIATQPYPGAHFATFPPRLVEPCIKAGTSERGVCPECGSPWRRVVDHVGRSYRDIARERGGQNGYADAYRASGKDPQGLHHPGHRGANERVTTTTGWKPGCAHDATPVPATVMDPFGGSGTTAMVAQHLSRRAVLIDLNPDYIDQQLRRNAAMPLGLDAA